MRILTGHEAADAMDSMARAAEFARLATCLRAKCGAIIESNGKPVGGGFNSPPRDESNRKCDIVASLTPNPRHDQTCCVHAEWRAIINALWRNPEKIEGSTLFFIRMDQKGKLLFSGEPYCTVCSRLALDVRIKSFALWQNEGIALYDTKEYNDLSYAYERPAK